MTESALDLFDDADLDGPVADAVRRLAVAGFHALWSGRTLTLTELTGSHTAVIQAADHLRARGRVEVSTDGHVTAIHGLTRRPTRHRIEHDGGVVNTWCALDAIGIPAALAIDARALTQCPTCGGELSVALAGGEPQPVAEVVLWYPQDRCGHLIDDFCSGANLFCSLDHLEQWLGDEPPAGRVMTIAEVAEVGREVWDEASDQLRTDADEVLDPPGLSPPAT